MSAGACCRARVLWIPAKVVVDLLPGLLADAALVAAQLLHPLKELVQVN